MPLIKSSSYSCPFWLRNPHLATIVPSLLRDIGDLPYNRERILTPDNDFLDLDWLRRDNDRLIVISHGLEGSSNRTYVKGLVSLAIKKGWDAMSWNCRSCSGEVNLLPRFYHHGDSMDLATVVDHINTSQSYKKIFLVGFSMGGSMTTKYLGEGEFSIPENITGGIAISTPFDLKGSAAKLDGPGMGFYRKRFLKKLGKKVELKSKMWPKIFDSNGYVNIKSFREFDSRYTAPLHGFKDANDFYTQASAGQHLAGIFLPFLIINAQDDPFLTPECYPVKLAENKSNIYLETPQKGGHVGFMHAHDNHTWSERRVFEFIEELT